MFAVEPTVEMLRQAVVMDIATARADEGGDCDQEDGEWLSHQVECLHITKEVVNNLDDAYCSAHGWQDVMVAGVVVGNIQVEILKAFSA
jgi:hypothetical protein